jgi:hypothetical protein
MNLNWEEVGTLRHTHGGYVLRTAALWALVASAKQGHEGALDAMRIELPNGIIYGPEDIQRLSARPDYRRRRDAQLR